jgi:hypothetical protein
LGCWLVSARLVGLLVLFDAFERGGRRATRINRGQLFVENKTKQNKTKKTAKTTGTRARETDSASA